MHVSRGREGNGKYIQEKKVQFWQIWVYQAVYFIRNSHIADQSPVVH